MLAMAAWVATPAPSCASETLFPDVPAWTSPVAETRGIAIGDVDGDGDLDVVRGSFSDPTTLTLNGNGVLATSPVWSGPVEPTRCIALGDVDGDGDLDLVRGNNAFGSTLYLNTGGSFETTPVWRGLEEQTRVIALADMDGDGDLDLIAANLNPGSTVYRSVNGRFEATPMWTSPVAASNGLAVGDVNGDGRPDIVLGNLNQPSTLFLNSASGLPTIPSWSGPVEPTRAVALGDIDGDGDLDLVRGNLGAGSTLTLNTGGLFGAAPVWTGPTEQTYAIALGDVDGDALPDLVRGNTDGATVTLAAAGTFASTLGWSGPVEDSRSLALVDLDGDGDLDLLRGNLNQASTLYMNVSSPLEPTPRWTGLTEETRALALGDVDGDGDLDLVRGNLGAGATLVRNTGGSLDSLPSWTGPVENTLAVALGDIDGDGDLDLIRGNVGQGSTLTLNVGGTFAAATAWTGDARSTQSVALGDLDGDGDLDLVLGNLEQGATVYINSGGTFPATASWTGPVEHTTSIALGDIDGDGDLDLVRGNTGQGATLTLNNAGVFAGAPSWTGQVELTSCVALADINGDGHLDLVRGNVNQGSTLTLNTGGTFAAAPAWIGPVEATYSSAFADLDGDGDFDLVRGNVGAPSTVTLNHGGLLDALPSATVAVDSSWSLALGDIDQDGDVDALAGRGALFLNRSPWLTRQGFASRALPNNAAHLRRCRSTPAAENHVTLAFDAVDVEADSLSIGGEYQLLGSSQWRPMALGPTRPAGPFATSAAGLAHTLDWNVTTVPFDPRPAVARLRAISASRRGGEIAFAPVFALPASRVVPVRPSLAVAPASLAFPTVTLGDTAIATLRITNDGNRALVLQAIDAPAPEVLVGAAAGFTVPPGESRDVIVQLAPRSLLPPLAPLHFSANDPARPSLDVALATDIRDLAFQTQLLAVAPELPLGQAATVVVTPALNVHLEGGWVLYRARGAAAFTDSSRLVRQGSNLIALVPSQGVTEAGLEFYVRVENSGVTRTDPPGAPAASIYYPVASPSAVVANASPDARDVFPQERDTPVIVSLPAGSQFVDGTLFFRAGGAASEDSVALQPREVSPGIVAPTATLPAATVGARGVQYWVRVRTLTNTLTDPPDAAGGARKSIRVTVDHIAEPASHAGARYRIVTIPLELDVPTGASIEALLSDQAEFGPPQVTRWRAFRYGAVGQYLEVGHASADPQLHPEPGRSFWLIARDANRIDTAPIPGRSTPADSAFHNSLAPGWNQVGNPFAFRVAWSDVRAENALGAVTLEPPVGWDEATQRYRDADVSMLEPFEGYWVRNPTPSVVDLIVPAIEALPLAPISALASANATENANAAAIANATANANANALPRSRAASGAEDAWQLRLTVTCNDQVDTRNVLGMDARAAEGLDPLDRSDPPAAPGPSVSLYFLDPSATGTTPLTSDFRPLPSRSGSPAGEGQLWAFDVVRPGDTAAASDALLTLAGLESVPPEFEVRLLDRELGRELDARQLSRYPFVSTRRRHVLAAGDARFELRVGTSAYIASAGSAARPGATRLSPIFPSPMSSSATIRFELAQAGPVRLDAFDVTGRLVCALARGEHSAGTHELSWRGIDDAGHSLPPGVYLMRLAAGAHVEQRRVVKIR